MTTINTTKKICYVCHQESDQTEIGSTNAFGSPDLDTRPPEMERSTITHWVQKCPHCGYCNSGIGDEETGASEIVHTDFYRNLLENEKFPELARSFLCRSYIYESLGDFNISCWTQIHAAWTCDDVKNKAGAKQCRLKAFELIRKLWDNNHHLMEQTGADYLLAADLLRRSGKFEEAKLIISKGMDSQPEDIIANLLEAQSKLTEDNNDLCYTMEEAMKLIGNG
jgi:hypothetical protein